jgi:hypothetical protein
MPPWHTVRDVLVVFFALSMGVWEILAGGGRPSVLAFLSGLILAPWVARIDAAIRGRHEEES